MAPEDPAINPSSLTKFRKQRLKDSNLLDKLIGKTVEQAIEKGILKTKSIIVDATHTCSKYNYKTPLEQLKECSNQLKKAIYEIDENMKSKFPEKQQENDFQEELKYNQDLLKVIDEESVLKEYPQIKRKLLRMILNNWNILQIKTQE